MILQPVLDRLIEQTTSFERVERALSDEPLTDLADYQSLFLLPGPEEGSGEEASDLDGKAYQTRVGIFSLLIAARIEGIDDMSVLRAEPMAVLNGFVPGPGYTGITWTSGLPVQIRGNIWWWQDFYSLGTTAP